MCYKMMCIPVATEITLKTLIRLTDITSKPWLNYY